MNKKVNKKKPAVEPRERIINSAVQLFARAGFARTGLRELATAADVNLAMINYFFGSKKGLLKEILDRFFSGYLAIAHAELTGDDEVQVKLGRFIQSAINYFELKTDYLLVTIAEIPHDDAEITEHKAVWGKEMMTVFDREICTPLSLNTAKKIPPAILGPMLTSIMASRFLFAPILKSLQTDLLQDTGQKEYSDIICNFLLTGLGVTLN